jgi:hypothetical protein
LGGFGGARADQGEEDEPRQAHRQAPRSGDVGIDGGEQQRPGQRCHHQAQHGSDDRGRDGVACADPEDRAEEDVHAGRAVSRAAIGGVDDDGGTSSDVAEPVTAAAATSATPAPPTAPAAASSGANGAGTDPATGVAGGHCKQVIGDDVRVFANPQDTQQTWTSWRRGTLFWAVVGRGTSDRYATSLQGGQAAWITKDSRYVVDAGGCP